MEHGQARRVWGMARPGKGRQGSELRDATSSALAEAPGVCGEGTAEREGGSWEP